MKQTHERVRKAAQRKVWRAEIAWINRVLEYPARGIIDELNGRLAALATAIKESKA